MLYLLTSDWVIRQTTHFYKHFEFDNGQHREITINSACYAVYNWQGLLTYFSTDIMVKQHATLQPLSAFIQIKLLIETFNAYKVCIKKVLKLELSGNMFTFR